jgi:hypothetical protein
MNFSRLFRIDFAVLLFLIVFLASPSSKAEEPPQGGEIIRLQREIDELRRSIEELRKEEVETIIEEGQNFGVNLGLFGHLNFSTNSREKAHSGFSLGDMDLYTTMNYGKRLDGLAEFVIEVEDNAFSPNIERLWVGYTFSDLLIIRAGKHHSVLGYWNRTYNHSMQLHHTVERPFFLKFKGSGSVIPVHITGLEFGGSRGYGFGRFKYGIQVGNGTRIAASKLKSEDASDLENSNKQVILRISFNPSALLELNVGLSGTTFKIDTSSKSGLRERILGADIAYQRGAMELLAEYFRIENSQAAGDAFYIQLAYNIYGDITPYTRFESLDADAADPYFSDLEGGFDRAQVIAGVRYDIDILRSSIKAQYRYDDTKGGNDYNVFETQWSFGF